MNITITIVMITNALPITIGATIPMRTYSDEAGPCVPPNPPRSLFSLVLALMSLSPTEKGKIRGQTGRVPLPEGLRIDPRRLVSKLLHVLNVRPGINRGMAVRAALAPQFQHAGAETAKEHAVM
jgi:hypothetical protein